MLKFLLGFLVDKKRKRILLYSKDVQVLNQFISLFQFF